MSTLKGDNFRPWRRPLIKPQVLAPGDQVAIVTPSWGGPACFPYRFETGLRYLVEQFELEPVIMPHACKPAEWLDRNPRARAEDLMQAFEVPEIAAIVASIGGDDAIRLVPHLDLRGITSNPKVFLGYSDATVLHFVCLKAGLSSFYGPTVMAGFAENTGMHEFSVNAIHKALFTPKPPGKFPRNIEGWTDERLDWAVPEYQDRKRVLRTSVAPRLWQGSGKVRGQLVGGCAEVLEILKGTDFWPSLDYWNGTILFYETSEEAPSPSIMLRWMRNCGAQGILGRIAGMVVGRPGGVPVEHHDDYGAAIARALGEYDAEDIPLITGLDFGHTDPMTVLPYGAMAEIDCADASLSVIEASVVPGVDSQEKVI